jgi:8-oxo-dGTP pyrophosphatase MutT (NUDIX family)
MSTIGGLHPDIAVKLNTRVATPSADFARALALTAIRETAEETGLLLGVKRDGPPAIPGDIWADFAKAKVHPDLGQIHFIARAITPPKRPRRFDSRFFAADATAIARRDDGFVGPDKELVELVWMPLNEAQRLDIPGITAVALEELQDRIAAAMSHDHPVPLYRMLHKRFVREIL